MITKDEYKEILFKKINKHADYLSSRNIAKKDEIEQRLQRALSEPEWIDWVERTWDEDIANATKEEMLSLVGAALQKMKQNMSEEEWNKYLESAKNDPLSTLYVNCKIGDNSFLFWSEFF